MNIISRMGSSDCGEVLAVVFSYHGNILTTTTIYTYFKNICYLLLWKFDDPLQILPSDGPHAYVSIYEEIWWKCLRIDFSRILMYIEGIFLKTCILLNIEKGRITALCLKYSWYIRVKMYEKFLCLAYMVEK